LTIRKAGPSALSTWMPLLILSLSINTTAFGT
jgi:hypothetical protein